VSGHAVLVALAVFAAAIGVPGAVHGGLWLAFRSPAWLFAGWWAGTAVAGVVNCLSDAGAHRAGWAAASAVAAVIAWLCLGRGERKDRARRWLGAKSRALRDALARKARELSVPRPVLAPGGAR
jgi:hypothetical protein